jgi:hypothetical protein
MPFNITEILSSLTQNGILQNNKFQLQFSTPTVMQGISIITQASNGQATDAERLITLRASNVRLPGIALMTSDVNRYGIGPFQKMAYNVSFTDTSIEFICDKNSLLYNYFYVWFSKIFDFSGQNFGPQIQSNIPPAYNMTYKSEYVTDLLITVFDRTGNQVSTVVMQNAYPISFNDISLGWEDQNNIIRLTVGFTFRNWTIQNISF